VHTSPDGCWCTVTRPWSLTDRRPAPKRCWATPMLPDERQQCWDAHGGLDISLCLPGQSRPHRVRHPHKSFERWNGLLVASSRHANQCPSVGYYQHHKPRLDNP
jgi:hypothetical protein